MLAALARAGSHVSNALTVLTWGRSMGAFLPIDCSETLSREAPIWPAWRANTREASGHPVAAQVLFVGCARNVAGHVRSSSKQMNALGRKFAEHRVLLWEDSSSDRTREALSEWVARDSRVRLLTGDPPAIAWRLKLDRVARLSFCRDVLLSEALRAMPPPPPSAPARRWRHNGRQLGGGRQEMATVPPPQLLISLDLDCPPVLDPHALAAAVRSLLPPPSARPSGGRRHGGLAAKNGTHAAAEHSQRQWHMFGGNSLPRYYDLGALRSPALGLDYDCIKDTDQIARRGHCNAFDIRIDPRARVVAVDSAFNGVSVALVEAVRRSGCRYGARPSLRTCEHVAFHTCLRQRGLRLGIHPGLLVACGEEHAHLEVPKSNFVAVHANGTFQFAHSRIDLV